MKTVLGDLQIVVDRHSDVLRNNALPFRILLALRTLGEFKVLCMGLGKPPALCIGCNQCLHVTCGL